MYPVLGCLEERSLLSVSYSVDLWARDEMGRRERWVDWQFYVVGLFGIAVVVCCGLCLWAEECE